MNQDQKRMEIFRTTTSLPLQWFLLLRLLQGAGAWSARHGGTVRSYANARNLFLSLCTWSHPNKNFSPPLILDANLCLASDADGRAPPVYEKINRGWLSWFLLAFARIPASWCTCRKRYASWAILSIWIKYIHIKQRSAEKWIGVAISLDI